MKRHLSYLLIVTTLIIGFGGVTRLVTYAAIGVPFNGWLQLSGGYAQVPYQEEIKLDPANGSFTIEGWIKNPYFTSGIGTQTAIYKTNSFQLNFRHYMTIDHETYFVEFARCEGNYCVSFPHALKDCVGPIYCPAPQGWFHFAYVYNQSTNKGAFFWNGQMLGSDENIPATSTEPIVIQKANSMDEFRISDNVRYTSSFTPASAPFDCDGNTQALWHFNEISGSTIFHDACGTVDNMFVGYNGAHTEGVTGSRFYLPLVKR